jgi:hypothetical protein
MTSKPGPREIAMREARERDFAERVAALKAARQREATDLDAVKRRSNPKRKARR